MSWMLQLWWYALTRRLDRLILWPAIRRQADTLAQAHDAFMLHAVVDPGWRVLGRREIARQVARLR